MKLLYRSTSGLLYVKHAFDRLGITGWNIPFVDTDWEDAGANCTVSVSSSRLSIAMNATGYNPGLIKNTAIGSRSKSFIEARIARNAGNPRVGVSCHLDNITTAGADAVMITIPMNFSATALMNEYIDGASSTLDSQASVNSTSPQTLWMFSDGKTIRGYDSYTTRNWSGNAATRASGYLGAWLSGASTSLYLYEFIASSDRYVTVNGLTAGDSIEIRGITGTVLASANESGGSATIDMMGKQSLAAARIVVVRDSADYAQFVVSRETFIVGGDIYELDEAITVLPGNTSRPQQEPRAVRYNGNIYFGGISNLGQITIAKYDISTGEITSTELDNLGAADSHYAPSLLVDSSGYIWVFYAKHGTETSCYYRKSSNPEDISAFAAKQTLTFSQNVTYPQVFQDSNGRIVLLVRKSTVGIKDWCVTYTDDGGSNWSAQYNYATSGHDRLYQAARQHSDLDTIGVTFFWHPTLSDLHDIYYCEIDLPSGDITVPGNVTPIGNLYDDVIDPENALQVFEATGSLHAYADECSEDREIVFLTWDPADKVSTGTIKYVVVASDGTIGTIRTVASAGAPITNDANTLLYGDCSIGALGVVYVARSVAGVFQIDGFVTADGGANWDSTQIDQDSDDLVINRQGTYAPRFDESSDPFVIYNRIGSYNATTFEVSSDLVVATGSEPASSGSILLNPDLLGGFTQRLRGGF